MILTRILSNAALVFSLTAGLILPANGSERVSGTFTAARACEAYKSFKGGTNPGAVKTVPGTTYQAVEINAKEWEWIRIDIPGVSDSPRWVSRQCGTADIATSARGGTATGQACNVKGQHDSYVLALSWQPGFCEHFRYTGTKQECDALARSEIEVNYLTLHGLWPNKRGCGNAYGNCPGPELQLERATIAKIAPWMPNFMFDTKFGAYEWKKHGTCQALPDDEYFLTAVQAVKIVNESGIGQYIKKNVGQTMSIKKFFDHVKTQHGENVAKKLTVVCSKEKYLQEIRLSLPLDFRVDGGIEQLAAGHAVSAPVPSRCGADQIYIERSGPN